MTDSIVNTTKAYPAIHIATDTDDANLQDWIEALKRELQGRELLSDEAWMDMIKSIEVVTK